MAKISSEASGFTLMLLDHSWSKLAKICKSLKSSVAQRDWGWVLEKLDEVGWLLGTEQRRASVTGVILEAVASLLLL